MESGKGGSHRKNQSDEEWLSPKGPKPSTSSSSSKSKMKNKEQPPAKPQKKPLPNRFGKSHEVSHVVSEVPDVSKRVQTILVSTERFSPPPIRATYTRHVMPPAKIKRKQTRIQDFFDKGTNLTETDPARSAQSSSFPFLLLSFPFPFLFFFFFFFLFSFFFFFFSFFFFFLTVDLSNLS